MTKEQREAIKRRDRGGNLKIGREEIRDLIRDSEELEKVKATTASLVQSLNELQTEKAALRAEIAELKRDKERLDWWLKNYEKVREGVTGWFWWSEKEKTWIVFKDARNAIDSAIDAAMKEGAK